MTGDQVKNHVSGSAGNVVMAGSVGSVTFAAPSVPSVIPAQSPPPPEPFTNREAELLVLRGIAGRCGDSRARPPVAAVSGMGGVGKTAFLRHAGASLAEDFPDGVLYAGFGPDGDSPSEAAARFLVGLGVPESVIPASFQRRLDLYRSMTAGRQVIAVFDDVADPAQVTALMPNSGRSLVLAAGKRSLEELYENGAVPVHLTPLSIDHGVELLAGICADGRVSAESDAARRLVELYDGLPLGVRVAAARLAVRPKLSIGRFVEELRGSGARSAGNPIDAKVFATFDIVYDELSDSVRRLYRLLGVLVGGHFGVEVLAAMCGGSVADVTDGLDELRRAHLVEERADGAYSLHQLVRRHALVKSAEHDTEADREAALLLAVHWWRFGAVAADVAATGSVRLRTFSPSDILGGQAIEMPRATAVEWLDREHANLISVMRAAAKHGWHDEVSQIFESLNALYDARKPLAGWVRAGAIAVDSAVESGNVAAEARARCLLAKAYQELERYGDAHAQLDRAREIAVGDRMMASTYDFTGNVHLRQSEFEVALGWFERALEINSELALPRAMGLMTTFIGRALGKLGRVDEALAAFGRARELVESAEAHSLVPKILLSATRVLAEAGLAAEAEEQGAAAIKHARESGASAVEADVLVLLAGVAERRGESGVEYRKAAAAAFERMGSPRAALVLSGLG